MNTSHIMQLFGATLKNLLFSMVIAHFFTKEISFNEMSEGCAVRIKIGLYFHIERMQLISVTSASFLPESIDTGIIREYTIMV